MKFCITSLLSKKATHAFRLFCTASSLQERNRLQRHRGEQQPSRLGSWSLAAVLTRVRRLLCRGHSFSPLAVNFLQLTSLIQDLHWPIKLGAWVLTPRGPRSEAVSPLVRPSGGSSQYGSWMETFCRKGKHRTSKHQLEASCRPALTARLDFQCLLARSQSRSGTSPPKRPSSPPATPGTRPCFERLVTLPTI